MRKTNRLENQKTNEHSSSGSKVIWFDHSKMERLNYEFSQWYMYVLQPISAHSSLHFLALYLSLFFQGGFLGM